MKSSTAHLLHMITGVVGFGGQDVVKAKRNMITGEIPEVNIIEYGVSRG